MFYCILYSKYSFNHELFPNNEPMECWRGGGGEGGGGEYRELLTSA